MPRLTVRNLIRKLNHGHPGLAPHLEDGVAVAIDSEIHQNAFLEKVDLNSEVVFMSSIEGG